MIPWALGLGHKCPWRGGAARHADPELCLTSFRLSVPGEASGELVAQFLPYRRHAPVFGLSRWSGNPAESDANDALGLGLGARAT